MKSWFQEHRVYFPGPALALAGAVSVRWVAPGFAGRTQAIIIVVGYLVVPLGLFFFASCLGRRAAQRAAAAALEAKG